MYICTIDNRSNIRKNLSDPELASAIKEYDELKRQLHGESTIKGHRTDLKPLPQHSEGWTQDKTADDLGISRQAVTKAIKIATAIEEYPELAKEKKGNGKKSKRKKGSSIQTYYF